MAKTLSKAARTALAATDWSKIDAMTDEDLAMQIAPIPTLHPIWRRRSMCAQSGALPA